MQISLIHLLIATFLIRTYFDNRMARAAVIIHGHSLTVDSDLTAVTRPLRDGPYFFVGLLQDIIWDALKNNESKTSGHDLDKFTTMYSTQVCLIPSIPAFMQPTSAPTLTCQSSKWPLVIHPSFKFGNAHYKLQYGAYSAIKDNFISLDNLSKRLYIMIDDFGHLQCVVLILIR